MQRLDLLDLEDGKYAVPFPYYDATSDDSRLYERLITFTVDSQRKIENPHPLIVLEAAGVTFSDAEEYLAAHDAIVDAHAEYLGALAASRRREKTEAEDAELDAVLTDPHAASLLRELTEEKTESIIALQRAFLDAAANVGQKGDMVAGSNFSTYKLVRSASGDTHFEPVDNERHAKIKWQKRAIVLGPKNAALKEGTDFTLAELEVQSPDDVSEAMKQAHSSWQQSRSSNSSALTSGTPMLFVTPVALRTTVKLSEKKCIEMIQVDGRFIPTEGDVYQAGNYSKKHLGSAVTTYVGFGVGTALESPNLGYRANLSLAKDVQRDFRSAIPCLRSDDKWGGKCCGTGTLAEKVRKGVAKQGDASDSKPSASAKASAAPSKSISAKLKASLPPALVGKRAIVITGEVPSMTRVQIQATLTSIASLELKVISDFPKHGTSQIVLIKGSGVTSDKKLAAARKNSITIMDGQTFASWLTKAERAANGDTGSESKPAHKLAEKPAPTSGTRVPPPKKGSAGRKRGSQGKSTKPAGASNTTKLATQPPKKSGRKSSSSASSGAPKLSKSKSNKAPPGLSSDGSDKLSSSRNAAGTRKAPLPKGGSDDKPSTQALSKLPPKLSSSADAAGSTNAPQKSNKRSSERSGNLQPFKPTKTSRKSSVPEKAPERRDASAFPSSMSTSPSFTPRNSVGSQKPPTLSSNLVSTNKKSSSKSTKLGGGSGRRSTTNWAASPSPAASKSGPSKRPRMSPAKWLARNEKPRSIQWGPREVDDSDDDFGYPSGGGGGNWGPVTKSKKGRGQR
ncbi:hypothetical protein ACHAXT_011501 [Thalassiosira profunda]